MSDAIAARGLRKQFGDDRVVEGADLAVAEGDIVVLLGPNGVGKTVLLSCLAGSERPTEGTVEVFGEPIGDHAGTDLAMLLQESMAVETLTGRENVAFYRRLHPQFTDRWERYVEAWGLAEDLDKRVEHYSGGMVRKLELALTLSIDVPVYLLDEPTAGVDLSVVQRIHEAIRERRADGATFVLASHSPMDADLADRIAVMPDGTITAEGTPDDLLADVPTTVRIESTRGLDAAREHLAAGQVFPQDSTARGFLADGASLGDLDAALGGTADQVAVENVSPTYTDLFNYYVHVRGNEMATSDTARNVAAAPGTKSVATTRGDPA